MAMHTRLLRNAKMTQVLKPAVYTTDQNSTSVDMKGYQDLCFLANIGISGDTLAADLAINLSLEHSDNNTDFVACLDAEVSTSVVGVATGTFAIINDPAEDDVSVIVGYKGYKRYVRCVYNVVGTHTVGTAASITAIRGLASSSV